MQRICFHLDTKIDLSESSLGLQVERQLRDLEVEDDGEVETSKEEEEAFIDAQRRREATVEETEAFEREMQGESQPTAPSM